MALNYLINHSCLRQVGGFHLALLAPEIKLTATTELLLKVALNAMTITL
jgi:hypothetical protein